MLSPQYSGEPLDLSYIVSLNRNVTCLQIAIATILCYDTITTFDKEVKYFWSSPRKTSSIVYFLNRYIAIFAILTNMISKLSSWAGFIGGWINIVLLDYILLLRVLALWSGAKKLAVFLKAFFAMQSAFMLGIGIYNNELEGTTVGSEKGFAFCFGKDGSPPLYESLYWAAPLAFELLLMILALYKAAEFWRETAGFDGFSLVNMLIQDQALYFVFVMICGIMNVALVWVAQHGFPSAAIDIVEAVLTSTSVLCILGCRLLVHLHEAGERGDNEGTSYRIRTISSVKFV
ncbi:hypothetical protein M0805_005175 [Coniferiporia weirii]|nr:hypothetical protein M0805_005175 [Coniferiporia weirii]